MPESIRYRMTRKNIVIDNSLYSAISNLYELYYLYLREHPGLAERIEDMIYDITDVRSTLRQFQVRCWKFAPPCFDTIDETWKLIEEARRDTLGKDSPCRGYFNALGRLRSPSLLASSKQDDQ